MPAPFTFLDRIDQLVDGPAAVTTTVRQLVLPGGDRPVTKAGDASRIPVADVRAHVVDVALGVIQERVRDGLVEALGEHFAAVRDEYDVLGEDVPFANYLLHSFKDGDIDQVLGNAAEAWDAMGGEACNPARLADALMSLPVADPDAVLARVGVTPEALDAIVAEVRKIPLSAEADPEHILTMDEALDFDARKLEAMGAYDAVPSVGWSVEWLGAYLAKFDAVDDLIREGVTYVLTDPGTVATGAELLGLADDAAFLAWAEERLMFSTPEQDRQDIVEVLKLAGQECYFAAEDVQAGVREMKLQVCAAPAAQPEKSKPAPAEPSDLTRAVSAALSALFDHGCESDKAMAAALGVERSVVAGARKNTAPWEPSAAACGLLWKLIHDHRIVLNDAEDALHNLSWS